MPSNREYSQSVDGVRVHGVKGFLPMAVLKVFKNFFDVLRTTALYFYDFGFTMKVSRLVRDRDIVQLENPSSGLLLTPLLKRVMKKQVVVDCHDVFQALRVEHTSMFRKILETFFEKRAYKSADLLLTVSMQERDYLVSFGFHNNNVKVVPNGVDVNRFTRSPNLEKIRREYNLKGFRTVVFVGNLNYAPNQEAIRLLSSIIAPKVTEKVQNVKFLVVGKLKSKPELSGLVFVGFVDNLSEVLSVSDVAVAPLFQGSGTRLKILEYLSCGLPVVSTSIGAEGLDVTNGVNILIEDNLEEFAHRIVELLNNKNLSVAIGAAAKELAVTSYEWENITKNLENEYHSLIS